MNNNMFGWDNCRVRFTSLRDGIYVVAERLANSDYYREKSLDGVLHTYNPVPGYTKLTPSKTIPVRTGEGTGRGAAGACTRAGSDRSSWNARRNSADW